MGIIEHLEMVKAISFMKKTDPIFLANHCADIVDHVADGELGDKRSEVLQGVAVPWIKLFTDAFCKRLLEDQQGGK